jgi:hypothetical protein
VDVAAGPPVCMVIKLPGHLTAVGSRSHEYPGAAQ